MHNWTTCIDRHPRLWRKQFSVYRMGPSFERRNILLPASYKPDPFDIKPSAQPVGPPYRHCLLLKKVSSVTLWARVWHRKKERKERQREKGDKRETERDGEKENHKERERESKWEKIEKDTWKKFHTLRFLFKIHQARFFIRGNFESLQQKWIFFYS